METKVCSCCKVEKPVSEFYKDKTKKNGFSSHCKVCSAVYKKDYQQQNKDKILAYHKDYRQQNKDKILARAKEYRESNKDKIAVGQKEYYQHNKDKLAEWKKEYTQKNKERVLANAKKYYQENKDQMAAKAKDYRQTNKPLFSALRAKRRAAKLKATPEWADLEQITEFYEVTLAFKLYTGKEYHVDHIVPLQSKLVCGLHVPANLQVLEAKDNLSKKNSWWPDMPT